MKKHLLIISMLIAASCAVDVEEPVEDKSVFKADPVSLKFTGDGEQKTVKITSDKAWALEIGDEAQWISSNKMSGEYTATIILTCGQNPSEEESRTAAISVTSEGKSPITISVTQEKYVPPVTDPDPTDPDPGEEEPDPATGSSLDNDGTSPANTYVVNQIGEYTISPMKNDGTAIENAAAATWLYMTSENLIKNVRFADGKICLEVGEVGGYGEIILQDAKGNVLWTYLIWSTETLEDVTIEGITVLDRTIGAWEKVVPEVTKETPVTEASCGCYYEWGHNNAFPGPNTDGFKRGGNTETTAWGEYTISCVYNTEVTRPEIDGSILQSYGEGVFFIQDETPEDQLTMEYKTANPWSLNHKALSTNSNNGGYTAADIQAFWGEAEKGLYDPCPAGYKVISYDQATTIMTELAEWEQKEFSNSWGRSYSDGSQAINFFAVGKLEWGLHKEIGKTGYEWTSTVPEDALYKGALIYNWHEKTAASMNTLQNNRACPVRCVKTTQSTY